MDAQEIICEVEKEDSKKHESKEGDEKEENLFNSGLKKLENFGKILEENMNKLPA